MKITVETVVKAEPNKVWDAWVDGKATPARATIECKLARPEFKIEIMVIAAVP